MQEAQLSHSGTAMTSAQPDARPNSLEIAKGAQVSSLTRSDHDTKENDVYKMSVLRFDKGMTEEEVDRQFIDMARNLGIKVPRTTQTPFDDIADELSTMSINHPPTRPPLSPRSPTSPSSLASPTFPTYTAQLGAAPSDSSGDQPHDMKSNTIATPSISSVVSSQTSVASSERSSASTFRKSLRRLTTKRRKSVDNPVPAIPLNLAIVKDVHPIPSQQQYISTASANMSYSIPKRAPTPHSSSTTLPESLPSQPPPPLPSGRDPSLHDTPASRQRSIQCDRLRALRNAQTQEQLRFIRFEKEQYRAIREKYSELEEETLARHESEEKALEEAHSQAQVVLEQRHLDAENDLVHTLETEKQACETRLKHMQAYCSPKQNVEGMPERTVTKKDYNSLEAQYRLRDNMENLHTSRINVLRERQAKQFERIIGKQVSETEALEAKRDGAIRKLESQREDEELHLKKEFAARKDRLVRRWAIGEEIERVKLENETGEAYGRLPSLEWLDRGDIDGNDTDSGHASGGSDTIDGNSLTKEPASVYDTTTTISIERVR